MMPAIIIYLILNEQLGLILHTTPSQGGTKGTSDLGTSRRPDHAARCAIRSRAPFTVRSTDARLA